MKYKAIGFDYGGVLNGMPGKYFGKQLSELLGVSHEEYLTAYFHHNKKINRGEVTWPELWKLVLTELGQSEKVNEVLALSDEAHKVSPNQDVINLVDRLKRAGYKVGLLSNNTLEQGALLRERGLDKHFDVFDISAETGLVKPEPQAFRHLADGLGVAMNEMIFIDDAATSLSTAKECGFTPIEFENYEQLMKELSRLGVMV